MVDEECQADDQMAIFNSLQIKKIQTDGGRWQCAVHSKAIKVATSFYATCPPIMAEINVEDVEVAKFECDTAASHNIMSQGLFRKLRSQRPDKVPDMKQKKLTIRLADGSVSNKQCGSVRVAVKAHNSKIVILDFFVLQGPNNLLGRLALEKMWPAQYSIEH